MQITNNIKALSAIRQPRQLAGGQDGQKLVFIYEQILQYLKKAQKGLKANNVEEVQWWFGDIFTTLCENKEIVVYRAKP